MPDGHQNPTVEDYISDENGETRRDAAKQPSSTKPMMPHLFHRNHRDAASDSGYSSHTSNTMSSSSHSQPASNFRPPPPPTTQHAAPKPAMSRSESQRHQSRPSRSDSMSKTSLPCTNKHCDDPDCASKRNGGRGYTLPLRPQSQQAPQHPQTTQYPVQDTAPYSQPPSHPYAQVPHGQPIPNYSQPPQPRQHASSTSRSRPTSFIQTPGVPVPPYQHGMPPPLNYNAQYHGLQASPSAYGRSYMAHHQSASGDWSGVAAHMASGSPRDPSGLYMPGHGMPIPSNGQAYRPGMAHAYSARQAIPTISGHDSLTPSTERAQPSQPVPSARYRSDMPGSFPGEPSNFGRDSDTSSSSESSNSEEEERNRHARHQRRREEKIVQTQRALEAKELMPPPMLPRKPGGRRPTLTHTHTAPAESKRTQSRGPSRHSRHSEPPFLPSEYDDLDRTRSATGKRHTPSYERIDRHPSLSNRPSSGRHRSGSILQESHVVQQQYVVEDANGRKTYYDTREEAETKARRLKQQQHMDAAEAYQATTPALTAETVKRAQQTQQREREHRRPASHVSGSSRKSTTSSARTGTESIQITRDGTTFSIPTNTTLQIRQTEEGETWVIGSGSPPREHSYYGGSSKSSGSRVGGRRNGSEYGGRRRDTKTEDDGYEPGL
jgi:hypothetical protein